MKSKLSIFLLRENQMQIRKKQIEEDLKRKKQTAR